MNVGIYKWTSPTGKIYVGQSKDLKQRKKWYLGGGVERSNMTKLKHSFKKYGVTNHTFDIIEYCSVEQLNEKEIYWGLYYDVLETGLNCKLGEQNCIFTEDTKNKMSKSKKGTKQTEEQKQKRKISFKKTWRKKIDEGFKRTYHKLTKETKYKINKTQKGKIISEETRKKISDSLKNKTKSKEHKENLSKAKKGKPIHTEESKQKLREIGKNRNLNKVWEAAAKSRSKIVLQYDKNSNFLKEWKSLSDAEEFYNIKRGADNIGQTIRYFKKTGIQRKAYGFIWKFK
jgi:group I intron endonuclease